MSIRNTSFPRSGVLVLGANSVQSLLPATLVSQVEALLQNNRAQDAVNLAEQQRASFQARTVVEEDETDELRYVYQRIGFHFFADTLFEDAGRYFAFGDLDPRILISYFPDIRGNLFSATDRIPMFSGVADHMSHYSSVYDLIRNYSPHIAPNTRDAPATAELRRILSDNAREMLEIFLRNWRRAVRSDKAKQTSSRKVVRAVDTALAKLLANGEKTHDLYALIGESHWIELPEVEETLVKTGQYNALCQLYKRNKADEKLLEAWSKLAEGVWTDDDIPDPVSDMLALLNEKKDKALTQRWGIWLIGRDADAGLKLLTGAQGAKRGGRSSIEEDLALLTQISEASAEAGAQFLEHLVLQKRSSDRRLHMKLATTCIEQLEACLADAQTAKLWRAKASSYASTATTSNPTTFLSYFAATTPESTHKRARLKAALFLQGSAQYDADSIRERLRPNAKQLALEMAIVEGKLGNHREALSILVREMHDSASAEAYCTLGGIVVPVKTAQVLGEQYGLQSWAALLAAPAQKGAGAQPMSRQPTADEDVKKRLLGILLEVYMGGGGTPERTAQLLNAQAVNLDVLDVVSSVPDAWPLALMSSFLTRSFRRTLHARHEGQIVKNVCMGENMDVSERTWLRLREEGYDLEEEVDAPDSDDDGEYDSEKERVTGEKMEAEGVEPEEYPFPVTPSKEQIGAGPGSVPGAASPPRARRVD